MRAFRAAARVAAMLATSLLVPALTMADGYQYERRINLRIGIEELRDRQWQGDGIMPISTIDASGNIHLGLRPMYVLSPDGTAVGRLDFDAWRQAAVPRDTSRTAGFWFVEGSGQPGPDGMLYVLTRAVKDRTCAACVMKVNYNGQILQRWLLQKPPAVFPKNPGFWVHESGATSIVGDDWMAYRFAQDGSLVVSGKLQAGDMFLPYFSREGQLYLRVQYKDTSSGSAVLRKSLLRYALDYSTSDLLLTTAANLDWSVLHVDQSGNVYLLYIPGKGQRGHVLAYNSDGTFLWDRRLPSDSLMVSIDDSQRLYVSEDYAIDIYTLQ